MHHVLITRYNLGLYSQHGRDELAARCTEPAAWMRHRLRLFRALCVPSIERQTRRDFSWLIYLDAATPQRDVQAVRDQLPPSIDAHLCTGSLRDISTWPTALQDKAAGPLITTRHDNDDALLPIAIGSIRRAANNLEQMTLIDAPTVLRVTRDGQWMLKRKLLPSGGSPCVSLYEPAGPRKRTVWSGAHHHIAERLGCPIVRLHDAIPFLLQYCHEHNLVNRLANKNPGWLNWPEQWQWILPTLRTLSSRDSM